MAKKQKKWEGGIKGLYKPTRESIEGFVLISLKSNTSRDVCVEGGGGGEGLQSVKGSCVLRRF